MSNGPEQSDTVVVQFDQVTVRFDGDTALDRVSFAMRAGETRVLLGAAGSGKTVLLKTAMGLQAADSGRVLLFGRDITRMAERELFELRSRVGILFQEGGLFDSLTVEENVAYPLRNQKTRQAQSESETEESVREALRFVELEHTLQQFPSELSGGMRRRVGIARAVVTEPGLVLYDSPTAGLDPITANTIMALIVKERDTRNAAALMATHRYQDGQLMANFRYNPHSGELQRVSVNGDGREGSTTRFMVMREGKLVFEGTQPELEASGDPYLSKFVLKR
ncbi:MAG: ATP-binding cassette domain-containing protein [Acidobacteria bacterium]|nr:ATP-binding cassette domain-containing protein [Acidobacteriota bacterium]